MKINNNMKILVVGLGLIGGSYAKALKKKGYTVNTITKEQRSIDYALENGIIDYGTTEIDKKLIGESDIVVFALYPKVFSEWIINYQHLLKSGAMITDVTGVKGCIVEDIQRKLRDDVEFVPAHPMAGREVYGVENSDDKIFNGANFIVVPTEKNTKDGIELCESLGYELGFKTVTSLSPEKHDEMIAFLSQLTHAIAVSLMCCNDNTKLCEYTGDSFRDLTRIARINENMWCELFLLNKEALLSEMDRFITQITRMRTYLADENTKGIKDMMICSTERRSNFDKK